MTNILDQIIANFLNAILKPKLGDIALIAEIKLTSPSSGNLGKESDVEIIAKTYEQAGADAISIVTNKKFFSGDISFIKRVKKVSTLPILCKDFIVDPFQLIEIKHTGAQAVLLIAKIVSKEKLKKLVELVISLGMEPVVEVQTEKELHHALLTFASCIAVNARDLQDFSVDIDRACGLIQKIPNNRIALGFSGISSRKDVEKYKKAGAKAVLVGTSLMKAKDIKGRIKELKGL